MLQAERSGIGRRRLASGLLLLALSLLMSGGTCIPPAPLAPSPGAPQYRAPTRVAVPGGAVDVAGGNLLVMRSDLDLDTQLGAFSVGATWNSATRRWTWSFDDVSYANGSFVDPTGASYGATALAAGAAIPGTAWVKLGQYGQSGANALATKGGLEYDFTPAGRPASIHWTSSPDPALRFTQTAQADGKLHTTAIDQCLAPNHDCRPVFSILYDGQGRVSQIADRAGRRALFGYDANGNLAVARDGLDVARGWAGFRYEYASGDLTAITSSEGERVQYRYDPAHRVVEITQLGVGNPSRGFAYEPPDAAGLYATSFTDPLGYATRFRYDGQGQLFEVTALSTGETTRRTWQALRVTSLTLASGVTTRWSYSGDDVVARTDPSGNVTTYAYQPGGVDRGSPAERPLRSASDPLGVLEQRSYDGAGRLLSIANGAGETATLSYGPDEMISRVTNPAGVAIALSDYGEHGHAARATLGGVTESFAYDAVGNLTLGPDLASGSGPGRGGIVSRAFDEDRNVSRVALADLSLSERATLDLEHRSDHRLLQVERPGGGDTRFTYDALGRPTQRSDRADGVWQVTAYLYDAAGRLTAFDRPGGMGERFGYDAQGRVTLHRILRDGALENSAGFAWSGGRLASMADGRSGVESYEYDGAGRLAAVAYGNGDRSELAWDARSRLVDTTLRRGDGSVLREIGLGYDAAGRESTVLDGGIAKVQRSFRQGRLAETRYGNGLVRSFSYDAALGTLAGAAMTNASSTSVETTAVRYDDPSCSFEGSCITAQTASYGALAANSYERYLLRPAESADPLQRAGQRVASWARDTVDYDLLSNLTGGTSLGVLDYNAEGNRLLEVRQSGGDTSYVYDAAGFCTSRRGVAIRWDGAGRVASVGGASWEWDALGRAVSSAIDGVATRRRFGGLVETDAAGDPRAIDLGEVRIDLAGGATRYRHFDFRGNVKLVTDAAGNVVAHHEYSAYGLDRSFGSDADAVSFARGRRVGDLFLLGHRLYDPLAARFLAPDPVYQLVNQYAYALGNPALLWDPSGVESVWIDGATAAAGYAGGRIGQAVGASAGAEWGAAIGALVGGPGGAAAGAAIGGFIGGAAGGAYGGAGAANMVHEALTGEQLFGLTLLPPPSGSQGAGAGSSGTPPAMSTGGPEDADRGFPIPPTHPCNGDACAGRGVQIPNLPTFDPLPAGGFGSCAPVSLGAAGDTRVLAALLAADGALALWIWARRRRRA